MALNEVDIFDRALARIGDQRIGPDKGAQVATSGNDITAAFPPLVTSIAHGFASGDFVLVEPGSATPQMPEVMNRAFRITVNDANSFFLDGEDASGYTAQTSSCFYRSLPTKKITKECVDAWAEVRDEVLQEHPWNKCTKRSRLARLESAVTITGATSTNPVVITAAGHGYANGDFVFLEAFVGGMTELNGRWFVVQNSATTFELAGIDGTDYDAYSSGGTSKKAHDAPFEADSEYNYRYTVPSDSLRIINLVDSDSLWVVEEDQLFTDDGLTVPIRYIFRNLDVTTYSPMLASVMAARLGVELAEKLVPDPKKVEMALIRYQQLLGQAKASDGREQSPMPLGEDLWIISRDGLRRHV